MLLAACGAVPASTSWPAIRDAPSGWTSIGAIQGDSTGSPVSRLTFSGRPVAVSVACTGAGTVFVVVGWPGVSEPQGPAYVPSTAFPCGSPADDPLPSRLELDTAPSGEADVKVFVLEAESATKPTSYSVSIEEGQP